MLILLILGALIALITFAGPWFMATPETTKDHDWMIQWTNRGFSIAAAIAGIGFLLGVTFSDSYLGPSLGGMRGNLLLAGLCFAFAGSKYFKRLLGSNPDSWS